MSLCIISLLLNSCFSSLFFFGACPLKVTFLGCFISVLRLLRVLSLFLYTSFMNKATLLFRSLYVSLLCSICSIFKLFACFSIIKLYLVFSFTKCHIWFTIFYIYSCIYFSFNSLMNKSTLLFPSLFQVPLLSPIWCLYLSLLFSLFYKYVSYSFTLFFIFSRIYFSFNSLMNKWTLLFPSLFHVFPLSSIWCLIFESSI